MGVILLIIAWLVLLLLGYPIGISLLISCVVYLLFAGYGLSTIVIQMVGVLNSFPTLAIPLFIFAANLMNKTGITDKLFYFAKSLVGHIPGGLGHVNILASIFFSGMSGSALADSGGLGQLEIKMMREAGYDDDFSGSVTAASSIIGPIIPPSIPMVLYGVVTSTSVGSLFLAGIIPGLLCGVSLMIMVYIFAKIRNYPKSEKTTLKEKVAAFKSSFLALMTPVIIIFGIFSGKFSPTEAAAITALYAIILSVFVYKKVNIKDLWGIVRESTEAGASIGIIIAAVGLFSFISSRERVPQMLTVFFLELSSSPIVFLIISNMLIFVLGAFIESMALMLTLVPILAPIATGFGIDPVQYGVVVVLNLMISTLTPPMGMSLFVVSKVGNIPYANLARAVLIWLIPPTIVLALAMFIPQITLFLPNLLK